jgi:RNA polymerase sigma-70 factor (ECF subfamily)
MEGANSTCWTVTRAPARADAAPEREEFARRYAAPIRAYLAARRRGRPNLRQEVDDAAQEVFVECFRAGGALAHVETGRAVGFRAFLYGVARNVALRFETRAGPRAAGRGGADADVNSAVDLDQLPADDPTLSRAFDRAWVQTILAQAVAAQQEAAQLRGAAAVRRVALLRRRFGDGVPIREIAHEWGVDAAVVHHEYARARAEFVAALKQVMEFHMPHANDRAGSGCTPGEIERQCAELAALIQE